MSKDSKIEVLPVLQTGSNCKTTAIAALDQYFGEKLKYSPIPLHKRYEGSGLTSMREIAKKYGSQQGELLEVKLVTDILEHIGFDAEVAECGSLENFRKIILQNLEKNHPVMAFFAVEHDRYLSGLPGPSTLDGTNEHATLIVGFDAKEDQVTILHWGQHYTFPLYHLYQSNQNLPETRKKEFYLPIKSENLTRKYQLLNEEEIKAQVGNNKLKVSIEPRPDSGFKNKLVQLKSAPDFKKITARRREMLADINLNYLVKRIFNLAPYNKKSTAETAGADYKRSIQAALRIFLDSDDEKTLLSTIEAANNKFFSDIFGEQQNNFIDINRKKSIKAILDKFKNDIILKISATAAESKAQTAAVDLFMIETTVKRESKQFDSILEEEFLIEDFEKNITISTRSLEDAKKSKFKTIDIDSITKDIHHFKIRSKSKTNILIADIPLETIKNNEKLKSLLSIVQPEIGENLLLRLDLEPKAEQELKEILTTIAENYLYISDEIKKVEDYCHSLIESEDDKLHLPDSVKKQLESKISEYRFKAQSCAYSKEKVNFYLTLLTIEIHRSLPVPIQKNRQVSIPVSLSQSFIIGIFEGFKQAVTEDEKYPLPKIKASILDCLCINVTGHCKALSGYRSYCIALEKQKSPASSLAEIVKKVAAQELAILQTMNDYRNKKSISVKDHLTINSFIVTVITSQVHNKDIMSGSIYPATMPHYLTLVDHENRIMQQVEIDSSKSQMQDFEAILKELLEKEADGEYIIYSNFSSHQTFFMLFKHGDKVELVFSDSNLTEYIFYDVNDKDYLEKIMQQLNDSHPNQRPSISPFYVTQLSPPHQNLDDEYGRTNMAWHAEQGNLELFKKTCKPTLLSVKDTRGYTPLMSAVMKGRTEIVRLILEEKYADKDADVQHAILIAITEEKPEIITLFSPYINEEIRKSALLTLMSAKNGIPGKNVAVYDELLKNGVDVAVYQLESGKSWMSLFLDNWLFKQDSETWKHFLECKESSQVILHRSHNNSTILMDIINACGLFETKESILLSTLNYCKRHNLLEEILPVKNQEGLTVFDLAAKKDPDLLTMLKKFEPVRRSSFLDCFFRKKSSKEDSAKLTPEFAGPG